MRRACYGPGHGGNVIMLLAPASYYQQAVGRPLTCLPVIPDLSHAFL